MFCGKVPSSNVHALKVYPAIVVTSNLRVSPTVNVRVNGIVAGVNVIDPPALMLVTFIVATPAPFAKTVQLRFNAGSLLGDGVAVTVGVGVTSVLFEAIRSHVYSPAVIMLSVVKVNPAKVVLLVATIVLFFGHDWWLPCGSVVSRIRVTGLLNRLVTLMFRV